jgi:hypothetical protein
MLKALGFVGAVRAVEASVGKDPKSVENIVRPHPIRDFAAVHDMLDDGQGMFGRIPALQRLKVGVAYFLPALYDPLNGLLTCGFADLGKCALRHVNSVLT